MNIRIGDKQADRMMVAVWALILAYVLAVIAACAYFTYDAFAATPPAPPGMVCTDTGVIPTSNGAISAAECHPR